MVEEEVFCCRLRRSFMCHRKNFYMQKLVLFIAAFGWVKEIKLTIYEVIRA